jgi:hypothetical protein
LATIAITAGVTWLACNIGDVLGGRDGGRDVTHRAINP